MTANGYLNDEVWVEIVPRLIKGIRYVVQRAAEEFGIDADTASNLMVGLLFDGCIVHLKNLSELIKMADSNVLALNEGRDSSEINQAFDRFVAKAGKRRAAITLDHLRRSHIQPVIDGWMLVLVGLQMLRDCAASRVWENSFVAVNLHPHHRIGLDDWLQKIAHFVAGADKFEEEHIDEEELLPTEWRRQKLALRQSWLQIVDDDGVVPSWDVDLIEKLRDAGMPLAIAANIFKIYKVEKRLQSSQSGQPQLVTPPKQKKKSVVDKNTMIYHLFKAKVPGMTNVDRFEHAVTVRNRRFGPGVATTPSPYLDLEITDDNKIMLTLSADDVNMHKVLQESTCKNGKRRKVAKRCLTALGGASGLCGFLNDEQKVAEIKMNLKFAESLEAVKTAEKNLKDAKAKSNRKKFYDQAITKCGLAPGQLFYKCHVNKLTCAQIKAVSFIQCGQTINGKLAELKTKLISLLDEDVPGVPEYPTQDEVYSDEYSGKGDSDDSKDDSDDSKDDSNDDSNDDSDDSVNVSADVHLDDMYVDQCVQVWWKGDKCWYDGCITDVDFDNETFEVFYHSDKQTLVHSTQDYKVREVC